jgi:hypothetical protein
MKNISNVFVLLIVVGSTILYSCKSRCVKGNGDITQEVRAVSDFSSVDVSTALKVFYKQASDYKVEVIADGNIIGYIRTEVHGGELRIDVKDKKCINKITRAEIHISAPEMKGVKASGASRFETTENINGDKFTLRLSGASQADLSGQFNSVVADLSGASVVNLSGNTNSQFVALSGASKYHAQSLESQTAEVDFSGASKGTISVQKSMKVNLSGASSLNYSGNPSITSQSISGGSSLNKLP